MFKLPRLIRWIASVGFIFLVLLTVFRLVFFLFYKPAGYPLPGSAFLMGLRLDLRVVSILALAMLLLHALPFINPFRNRRGIAFWSWTLSILLLVLVSFYVVDFFHYDYLRQRLNASVLNYLQDAGISLGMVWETYPVIPVFLGMILLTWLGYVFFKKLLERFVRLSPSVMKRRWITVALFIVLLLAGTWGTLGQFALRWSDVFSLKDAFRAQLALNPMQSFFSTMSFRNSSYDAAETRKYYQAMAGFLGVERPDSISLNFSRDEMPQGFFASSDSMNVVLVIAESFSSYKSSLHGNPLNASPYFDSLARQGVFFDHFFTPSYGTARGVWATITGIPDVEAPKTSSRNPSLVDQHTIINAFTNHEKLYFIGGSASWANIRGLLEYNIQGLDLYEQEDFQAERVDVWGVSDKNLFLEANGILSKKQRPFFAIIQTADNHRPYTIPEADLGEFKKLQLPADSLKKYGFISIEEYNAFRYMDYCIQKFMEAASAESYFKKTLFVFIGDHGIRGDAGNMFPKAWTEQALTTVHVPLLFYASGLPAERRGNIASQLDVLPSIAGLLSIPHRNNTLGRNLFDPGLLRDPFRASSAFIVDPDEKKIGMVAGDHYLRKTVGKPGYELVSIRNNEPLADGPFKDSIRGKLEFFSDAFYQTSRYLLYHNKKNQSPGP